MLEQYKVFTAKPTNKAELKTVLEAIWEDLPQEAIDLAVLAFRKRPTGVHSSRWRSLRTPTQIESAASTNGPFQGQKSIQKEMSAFQLTLLIWVVGYFHRNAATFLIINIFR